MAKTLLFSPLENFLINPKEFPPLGILYLSSYLKQYNHEVHVIHGNIEDIKQEYDFYGISSSTPQYPQAKLTMEYLKANKNNAKVILGGPHNASPKCSQEALEHGFDYVVVGPGEKSLIKILNNQEKPGIIYGEPLAQDQIDNLLPDREAISLLEYSYHLNGGKATTIITARGCPYKCAFCSKNEQKVIFRNPEKVLEEINLLKNRYGFDKFLFLDDSFTANKTRLIKILKNIENEKFQYRCYARSDNSYDEEILKFMLNSGCVELGAGIESGSQKILDLINKKTKVENNIDFIKKTQKIGINANPFVMIGLPGESYDTIIETRNFIQEAKPATFGYNIFTPFPDCPIVLDYDKPFKSKKFYGKSFKDFITLHEMPYEKAVTKAKEISNCYVSTPDLSRQDIIDAYHQEFERFVQITGFDPRKRNIRGKT